MTRINDRSTKTLKRFTAIIIAVMIITAMLSSCRKNPVVSSIDELNSDQYSIGVGIGEAKVKKYLPNAKVVEFADTFSGYMAVAQGKLDAYAFDRIQLELAIDQGQEGIKLLDGTVGEDTEIAVGISPKTKVPDLKDKLNAFIAESRDSGLLDQMYTDWLINNKDQLPDIEKPTSALDPTMVGEVEAVIKELSKGDKTLLIVTHEMRFARQVSSRIFYMDEGGIYEDGTPEQIFENPQKENTRRFIKKLKVLEFELTGVNNDYVGMFSDITRFCMKNQISPVLKNKIISVIEELCFTIILPKLKDIDLKITIEASELGDEAVIKMSYPDAFDPATTDDDISLKIVKARTESIKYIRQNDRSIVKVVVNYELP